MADTVGNLGTTGALCGVGQIVQRVGAGDIAVFFGVLVLNVLHRVVVDLVQRAVVRVGVIGTACSGFQLVEVAGAHFAAQTGIVDTVQGVAVIDCLTDGIPVQAGKRPRVPVGRNIVERGNDVLPLLLVCRVVKGEVKDRLARVVGVVVYAAVAVATVAVTDNRRHADRDLAVRVGGRVSAVADGDLLVDAVGHSLC